MQWLDRSLVMGPRLCLCLTEKAFHKAMADCGIPTEDHGSFINPGAGATTHVNRQGDGQYACVVTMDDWQGRNPIEVAGLLIHEAVHVYQTARDDIMDERRPGSEFEAYSIQWISQQLMWSFVEQTKGNA